jgi:hypothetical protein
MINYNELYKKYFNSKSNPFVEHYVTPDYSRFDDDFIKNLDTIKYTWKSGDSWWKISQAFFGRPSYGWILGLLNRKPMEWMVTVGDTIIVPRAIEDIIVRL